MPTRWWQNRSPLPLGLPFVDPAEQISVNPPTDPPRMGLRGYPTSRRGMILKGVNPLQGAIRPFCLDGPSITIGEYNVKDWLSCSFGHSLSFEANRDRHKTSSGRRGGAGCDGGQLAA